MDSYPFTVRGRGRADGLFLKRTLSGFCRINLDGLLNLYHRALAIQFISNPESKTMLTIWMARHRIIT
jgi:hypothetical protein